jgi:hypothetical protein
MGGEKERCHRLLGVGPPKKCIKGEKKDTRAYLASRDWKKKGKCSSRSRDGLEDYTGNKDISFYTGIKEFFSHR